MNSDSARSLQISRASHFTGFSEASLSRSRIMICALASPTEGLMDNELIKRVFAIVQALEKCHRSSRRMAESNPSRSGMNHSSKSGTELNRKIDEALNQQEEMLIRMRRQANKLQIFFARKDWLETVHTLQIFYGLNHMVRPEIMATYATLANGGVQVIETPAAHASMH